MNSLQHNGNLILGNPIEEINSKIIFKGKNGKVIFGANVSLNKARITVGDNGVVEIADNCQIKGEIISNKNCCVSIGANTKFNGSPRIHANERSTISIGKGCLFANPRFRTSDSHSIISLNDNDRINPSADIIIGDNVWIAEDVHVYKGCTIGEGSIIGACSVVTKSIPRFCLAVGNPAMVKKENVTWREKLIPC